MTDWPDTEGAVRAYLRSHAAVTAVVGQRSFFGVPTEPTYPLISVARVGGFEDPSDAPIDRSLMQLDGWGGLHGDTRNSPNKAEAGRVHRAIRQAMSDLTHTPVDVELADGSVVHLSGGSIESDPYLEDPGNKRPHYPVTVQITAHQLTPAP